MRIELGLVLKHVGVGAEKVNAVNYLSKPPLPNDEHYYEEDFYAVNDHTLGFRPNAQGSNQENWRQGQENQDRIYVNYNCDGNYVQDGYCNHDNNFNRGNYVNKNDWSWSYVQPQNCEVAPRDGGGSMVRVMDMMQRRMRRFDASDEHTKELRNDLVGIGKKVDTHVISIKHLELQMAQLSAVVNTLQPGTLFVETLSKIQKMMGIIWQSLLGVVNKPLIQLCRLV